jgi:hypothetical protein
MVIASVRFRLRAGTTLEQATQAFEASSSKYQNVPGLITKHYVFGNGLGGGIYIWETREQAERLYTPEWRAMITERYGTAPEIEWLESPVTVDNRTGKVIVEARKAA